MRIVVQQLNRLPLTDDSARSLMICSTVLISIWFVVLGWKEIRAQTKNQNSQKHNSRHAQFCSRSAFIFETHNNIRTLQSEFSGVKLTRFKIEGWLELIGTPSVNILHQSDCAWPCCVLSQLNTYGRGYFWTFLLFWPSNVRSKFLKQWQQNG